MLESYQKISEDIAGMFAELYAEKEYFSAMVDIERLEQYWKNLQVAHLPGAFLVYRLEKEKKLLRDIQDVANAYKYLYRTKKIPAWMKTGQKKPKELIVLAAEAIPHLDSVVFQSLKEVLGFSLQSFRTTYNQWKILLRREELALQGAEKIKQARKLKKLLEVLLKLKV